ncbi:hypothetical protein GALMADRAFT_1346297 [Galerina marginata CBS 339.88]|uniref:Nephrocystin 3-like N-terminal domain-containing protein n=1 Tax=Galerina marginata (strain CBS 339.88) TaxID=685588 RepID=A0A067SWP7_GALM3|nr:hypothetical protein GALMADRAFT_1346297 [Galerina marginata CBS 339.88]
MFENSQDFTISQSTFNQEIHLHEPSNSIGFERLVQAASPSAFHNSGHRFDPPKCHPKTRLKVLEKIHNWIDGTEHPNEPVMWVNGGPGVGKSAIAQSMAERLAEEKRLVASFFFSRTDPFRNKADSLVSTIAYHAALHIPALKEPITLAITRDPLIFKLSIDAQFSTLLTKPIQNLADSGYFQFPDSPRVVIIDGLDECSVPDAQVAILVAITNALRLTGFPLLFLIASRPESHLSGAFASKAFNGFLSCLTLDHSFFPDHDIQVFLEDQFQELKDSHPMRAYLPPSWPLSDLLETLVRKASGQFIYASTVIKYISSRRHRPNHRLDIILGLRPSQGQNPFSELDELYMHILSSVNAEDIERVLNILGFHLFISVPYLPSSVEAVLSLEEGDVQIALADLATVVRLSESPLNISIIHSSFSDFLLDQGRSKVFYIQPDLRRAALAERYFTMLNGSGRFPLPTTNLMLMYIG